MWRVVLVAIAIGAVVPLQRLKAQAIYQEDEQAFCDITSQGSASYGDLEDKRTRESNGVVKDELTDRMADIYERTQYELYKEMSPSNFMFFNWLFTLTRVITNKNSFTNSHTDGTYDIFLDAKLGCNEQAIIHLTLRSSTENIAMTSKAIIGRKIYVSGFFKLYGMKTKDGTERLETSLTQSGGMSSPEYTVIPSLVRLGQ